MFDPKTDKFPYPMETDRHYLELHMDRGIVKYHFEVGAGGADFTWA